MSDIIERLRSKSTDCHVSEEDLYNEAAAEIERLRAALKSIAEQYSNQDLSHLNFRVHAFACATEALDNGQLGDKS